MLYQRSQQDHFQRSGFFPGDQTPLTPLVYHITAKERLDFPLKPPSRHHGCTRAAGFSRALCARSYSGHYVSYIDCSERQRMKLRNNQLWMKDIQQLIEEDVRNETADSVCKHETWLLYFLKWRKRSTWYQAGFIEEKFRRSCKNCCEIRLFGKLSGAYPDRRPINHRLLLRADRLVVQYEHI